MTVTEPVSAQPPPAYGVLSADSRILSWQPDVGTPIEGRHDDLGLLPADHDAFSQVFKPDGLAWGGESIPAAQIVILPSTADRHHAEVVFRPPTDGQFAEELLWTSGEVVRLEKGDFWPGSVVCFGGEVTILGEVAGNIIAIGSDVTVEEAATVRGMVIVIGGILRQRGDGKVYGDIFSPGGHRRPRLTINRAWEFEDEGFGWHPEISYDRVDGFRGGLHVSLRGGAFEPQARLMGAYAFTSETWQYRMEVRQRLARSLDLEAVASVFRLTETEDDSWVSRGENTLFAALAGSDYRDYFGADGGELQVVYKYLERSTVSLTYRNTDYRWLPAHPGLWHLFRPDHDFRSNFSTVGPPLVSTPESIEHFQQRTSAVFITLAYDPVETSRQAVGFNAALRATYEVAGGGLGGDFDYDRIVLDGRGWWDTGRLHRLTLRAFYGAGRRDLPPNKLFYLGGIGSLRGYGQKVFVGDEALFATVEYRFNYWPNEILDGGVILFIDAGRATTDNDFWSPREFKTDVGFGLALGDAVRIDVAKGLDYSDRDIKVTVHMTGTL